MCEKRKKKDERKQKIFEKRKKCLTFLWAKSVTAAVINYFGHGNVSTALWFEARLFFFFLFEIFDFPLLGVTGAAPLLDRRRKRNWRNVLREVRIFRSAKHHHLPWAIFSVYIHTLCEPHSQ